MIPIILLAAATSPADYRAVGTEPFWNLSIDARRMRLSEAGRAEVAVPTPRARVTADGRRYASRSMTVEIVRAPCSDGMSDRTFPDRVTVRWRGRILRGCGGAANHPAMALAGTAWRITAADGRAVHPRPEATIRFDGERATGRAACNSFSAAWRADARTLTLDNLAMTRRACVGLNEWLEPRFVEIVAAPMTMTMRGATLTLTNRAGSLTLTRM